MKNTYLEKHKAFKPEKLGGKKLTIPGLYVKPYEALQQYSDKSQEQKMADAYKEEGMPIPNFEMMDKIEKLEALGEWQAIAKEKRAHLDARNQELKEAHEKEQLNKYIDAQVQKRQQSATGTGS